MTDAQPGPREEHRLLVERLEAAARAGDLRAQVEHWRGRGERERSEALRELMAMAHAINRSRPVPYVKPPLAFPRLSSRPGRR
jgi:hypothetical protein